MTFSWGHKLYVDPGDLGIARCLLVYKGIWEPLETETFISVLKKDMVVVDVGANVGYYTLLAARSVGSGGKVFAFEPEPKNYELLCKNVNENGYTNVVTVPSAVSDRGGTNHLFLSANNSGAHNLSKRWQEATFVDVNTVSLDEYFCNYEGRIDVLKVDAEGAEELIFDGMSQLLKRYPNLILFTELNPPVMGCSPERYLQKLSSQGFRILELREHDHTVRAIEMEGSAALTQQLHDPGIGGVHADLVCVRGQRPRELGWLCSDDLLTKHAVSGSLGDADVISTQ
ncbi:MAG: FkbM family methyltransferase [Terriglobales bacterium]